MFSWQFPEGTKVEFFGGRRGVSSAVVKAGWFCPLLHVASIERSIEFYKLLGFEVIDTDGCQPHLNAWLKRIDRCES